MRVRHVRWVGLLLAVLLFLTSSSGVCQAGSLVFRTPGVAGDTSSEGAVITMALFATICVVMVLLGLRADYQNVFGEGPPAERQAREARFAERMNSVFQDPEFGTVMRTSADHPETEWANVGLGLRLEF